MPDSTTGPQDEAAFWNDMLGCLPRLARRIAPEARRLGVDVEDVLHDVVIRAFQHRHLIDPGKLLAWCTSTAHNRMLEMTHRGEDAHRVPVADITEACDASGETSPDTADVVWTGELVTTVREALRRLPKRWRPVMEATVYRELSQAAIADELGLTVGAVNSIQHRARVELRRMLKPVHLSAMPVLLAPGKAMRRLLWPARVSAPSVAAGTAMIVTLTAVLQYAAPLGPRPADASTSPEVPRIAAAPAIDDAATTTLEPDAARERLIVIPRRNADEPTSPPRTHEPPRPHCTVMCLVPDVPTPPTDSENGDQVSVNMPTSIQDYSGPVAVRQGYAPICDHWVHNPAANCTRHGKPDWVVQPPPKSANTF